MDWDKSRVENSSNKVRKEFMQTVREWGGMIRGVEAAWTPKQGIGLHCTREVRKNEEVVFIPKRLFLTPNSGRVRRMKLPSCSGQGQIAAYLTLSLRGEGSGEGVKAESKLVELWRQTWPCWDSVRRSFPYFWPENFHKRFPESLGRLVRDQGGQLRKDLTALSNVIRGRALRRNFVYYYFIVNSRALYWNDVIEYDKRRGGDGGKCRKVYGNNRLALCPFIDFVNHDPSAEPAQAKEDGYSIVASRDFKLGEQIFVSYGAHNNDALLAEYGFMIPYLRGDFTGIDDIIIPLLSVEAVSLLQREGYLNNYALLFSDDQSERMVCLCHRSMVALLANCGDNRRIWKEFTRGGMTDEGRVKGIILGSNVKRAFKVTI